MGIKELASNERIVNQANFALTIIATALASLSTFIIANPSLEAIPYIMGAWLIVWGSRTVERFLFEPRNNRNSSEPS